MANVTPIIEALEMLRQIGIGHGLPGQPTEEFHAAEKALKQFKKLMACRGDGMLHDVAAFYERFGIPAPATPRLMERKILRFRTSRLIEELMEFVDAHGAGDLAAAADALVDLVYVALGTAIGMGLPWPEIWEAVHAANMKKERAGTEARSRHRFAGDVVKPEGWQAPDLWPILRSATRRGEGAGEEEP